MLRRVTGTCPRAFYALTISYRAKPKKLQLVRFLTVGACNLCKKTSSLNKIGINVTDVDNPIELVKLNTVTQTHQELLSEWEVQQEETSGDSHYSNGEREERHRVTHPELKEETFYDESEKSSGHGIDLDFHSDHDLLQEYLPRSDRNDHVEHQVQNKLLFTRLPKRSYIFNQTMTSTKYPRKTGKKLISIEGKFVLADLMKTGICPKIIFFSSIEFITGLNIPKNVRLYKVPHSEIEFWSSVKTNQGAIGIFNASDLIRKELPNSTAMPLTIICDEVRNPINMGSVLRVAAGVGCKRVICTSNCASILKPAVIRSASGMYKSLCIEEQQTWSDIEQNLDDDATWMLADRWPVLAGGDEHSPEAHSKHAIDIPAFDVFAKKYWNEKECVLIIGGERGLSRSAYEVCSDRGGHRVYIPLENDVDSLNCATALSVIVFEIKRQWQIYLKNKNITADHEQT